MVSIATVLVVALGLTVVPGVSAPAAAAQQAVGGTVRFGSAVSPPAGVTATVTWARSEGTNDVWGPPTGVVTDSAGRWSVSLEPGLYLFYFVPSSRDFQSQFWQGTTSITRARYVTVGSTPVMGISPRLDPVGSISGRVFLGDATRPAVAGEVIATASVCDDDGCTSGGEPTATTDANGTFRFTGLQNGQYSIRFSAPSRPDIQPKVDQIDVVIDARQQVFRLSDTILPRAATLSGKVTLGSGSRAARAGEVAVVARQYSNVSGFVEHTAQTDASGMYSFPGLPRGQYDLRFEYRGSDGFATQWWPGAAVPSADGSTRFRLEDGPVVKNQTLVGAAAIAGEIKDSSGKPVSGVEILASAYDPVTGALVDAAQAWTEADGRYSFVGLAPGKYRIGIFPQWQMQTSLERTLRSGDDLRGQGATVYRGAGVQGSVECPKCGSTAVAAALTAVLERNTGTSSAPRWTKHATDRLSTATSANLAYYSFRLLMPGSYRVRIVGAGQWTPKTNASTAITLSEGEYAQRDLAVTFESPKAPGLDRDLSGDGLADVLVRTSTGALRLYRGNGAGGWAGSSTIGSGWNGMNHVFSAGDFSGDGSPDIIGRDASGRLHLYRGDGKGGWLGSKVIGTGWGSMTAIFSPGDFSGDGAADILARDRAGNLWLYRGNGKGGFVGGPQKVGTGWNAFDAIFAVGNFDGKAGVDVMARRADGRLYLYPGSGSGGWRASSLVGSGWQTFDAVLGAGDFNGDGRDDVLARDRSGRLKLYPGNGEGGWRGSSTIGSGWGGLRFVA